MFKLGKNTALAATLALAPLSASALSFGGSVNAGDTYNFTDGQQTVVAVAIRDTSPGSFSFNVTNDAATTWTFNFGSPFMANRFPGGRLSFGPEIQNVTGPFSAALAAGETVTLTVFYDDLVRGDVFGARFSAVPLPAGLVLLLSALGIAAVVRGRRRSAATA